MDGKNLPDDASLTGNDNPDIKPDDKLPVVQKNPFMELQKPVAPEETGNLQSSPLHSVKATFGNIILNSSRTPGWRSPYDPQSGTLDHKSPHSSGHSALIRKKSLNISGSPASLCQHCSLSGTRDLPSPKLHGVPSRFGNNYFSSSGEKSLLGEDLPQGCQNSPSPRTCGSGAITYKKSFRKSGSSVPYHRCPRIKLNFPEVEEYCLPSSVTSSRIEPSVQVPSSSLAGTSGEPPENPINLNLSLTISVAQIDPPNRQTQNDDADPLCMNELVEMFRVISVSDHNQSSSKLSSSGAECASGSSQGAVSYNIFEAFGRLRQSITSLFGYTSEEIVMHNMVGTDMGLMFLLGALHLQLDSMMVIPEAAPHLSIVDNFSSELNRISELTRNLETNLRNIQMYNDKNSDGARKILRNTVRLIEDFLGKLVPVLRKFGTHFMCSLKG